MLKSSANKSHRSNARTAEPVTPLSSAERFLGAERSDQMVYDLAETFQALSDPTRVRLLLALSRGECSVGALADQVKVTPSAISHQLRLLRGLRLVRHRRQGKRTYYALDDKHIRRLLAEGVLHVQER